MTSSRWPDALPARAVRFARSTRRLPETSRFYREIVGLPPLTEFHDHDGYDGVVFALPDRSIQLELVTPPHSPASEQTDRENALVIYLADPAAAAAVRARLRSAHLETLASDNPYWTRRGAFGAVDPDGRPVLFVPTPDDQEDQEDQEDQKDHAAEVEIVRYDRPHRELIDLFREAEDSETALDQYIDLGSVWVARDQNGTVVGHLQTVARDDGLVWEVLNTAVVEAHRGRGVGRRLMDRVVAEARQHGARRLDVATASADVGNLRYYQRCGFRMSRVVRDAFVPRPDTSSRS
jgi:GNAT superfamily N-acetyltransferase